ncbi:hypothetical protein PcaKH35_21290 [Parageobacillus caldoxylosilyticus]|nr:hypothetical protein PcaKH35_21290 [Parageobacillus caldoxylosilyticus]
MTCLSSDGHYFGLWLNICSILGIKNLPIHLPPSLRLEEGRLLGKMLKILNKYTKIPQLNATGNESKNSILIYRSRISQS